VAGVEIMKKRTERGRSRAASGPELDAFFAEFLEQPAKITPQKVSEIEEQFCGLDYHRCRRGALASLTSSARDLVENLRDREAALAFAYPAHLSGDYAKQLRLLADLMECASRRISVALCNRPDMHELLALVRKKH
jgi:hypothetical protein